MFHKLHLIAALVVLALMATATQAATFTTTTINGDADVGINTSLGTYLLAVDMYGDDATTINGVAFTNAGGNSGSGGGLNWTLEYITTTGTVAVTGVSSDINAVLSGYRRNDSGNYQMSGDEILRLSGLTIGTDYVVSMFTVAGAGSQNPTYVDDNNGLLETVALGDTGTAYRVDYTFTASDSDLRLNFDNYGANRSSQFALTALTVREAGGVQTPEPSTAALLGLGALGLIAYGWRKRK